ncbi:hypothetical protein TWF481_011856 [Arthrobotrys musiformis]|uniref:Uncharacterized protein n=1 Tax=Arthrobotrys musiformis TaxID=47236 RepID=A0AAV9VWE3_9PEZI
MVPHTERGFMARWRDSHTGIVILVMFVICAPTLQKVLSYLSGVVTYILIPVAILFKILDIYLLNIRPVNRFIAHMLEVDNIESVKIYLTVESDDNINTPEPINPGPFELPNNTTTTSSTAIITNDNTAGTDTMSSSPIHIPSRSPSPSDIDSYDRLSDISPHSSPTMAHSAKWSGGGSILSDDQYTAINTPAPSSIPTVETPPPANTTAVYKTDAAGGRVTTGTTTTTKAKKPDIKIVTSAAPRFPVLPTEVMIEPNSATAPQPVEAMPWNKNSFSNPAIQEKLRQQSVLYHQIHDLLAEHLGTRNKSVVEANKPTLSNLSKPKPPLSPIPEPTYKVEGVDYAKIQALKNKYPHKQALHKHLDSFSAIMSRFMALSAPDVSVLDLKDPVYDEKKPMAGREADKSYKSPRAVRVGRPVTVADSPTLPPLPRANWYMADIPEEKLV